MIYQKDIFLFLMSFAPTYGGGLSAVLFVQVLLKRAVLRAHFFKKYIAALFILGVINMPNISSATEMVKSESEAQTPVVSKPETKHAPPLLSKINGIGTREADLKPV